MQDSESNKSSAPATLAQTKDFLSDSCDVTSCSDVLARAAVSLRASKGPACGALQSHAQGSALLLLSAFVLVVTHQHSFHQVLRRAMLISTALCAP